MRAAVVGAGPIGTYLGIALARQGHQVLLIDRDPGPPSGAAWERRGVMQFSHPHFFRPQVRSALMAEMPDVWDALLAAGGLPAHPDGAPAEMTGLQCRRATFERAVWAVAAAEPGLTRIAGHAETLVADRGRVAGLVADGRLLEADLIVCAAGRSSRFAADIRARGEGGPCGFSYVSRMYRARPGVETSGSGFPMGSLYRGYLAIVFPQDDRTLSALLVRASSDDELARLRHTRLFESVAQRVPQLAPWTDPARYEPITDVMPGGGLTNTYRGQLDDTGRVPMPGLVFVGDAVSTTNPAAGRGVSLGLLQAHALVRFLRDDGDMRDVTERFDRWCTDNIRPWYEDHVRWDTTLSTRFSGGDIDLTARIPSDVICAAAEIDPAIGPAVGPYLSMMALPSVLDPVEDRARAVLATGWRPPCAEGPSREDLVDLLDRVAA